jgi:hypothetical protein
VYIIPENYWPFFASSNALCVWGISKLRIGASHTKEGFKDIEEYAYSESEIRPIKISSEKSESDPIPAQGQSTYWLVENIHN